MATVFVPPQLRDVTGGADRIEASGATVREVIDEFEARFPGIAARLLDGEHLAAGLAVSIDGTLSNRGLQAAIGKDSELHFLPALGGG